MYLKIETAFYGLLANLSKTKKDRTCDLSM